MIFFLSKTTKLVQLAPAVNGKTNYKSLILIFNEAVGGGVIATMSRKCNVAVDG